MENVDYYMRDYSGRMSYKKIFAIVLCMLLFPLILTCQRRNGGKGGDLKITLNKNINAGKIKKIAVFPWDVSEYRGDENISGESVADLYITEFMQAGYIIIERNRIKEILKEQGLQMRGFTADDNLLKTGRMLGADGLVFGRVLGSGSRYVIILKCISVEKGSVAWNIRSDYANPKYIVSELVQKIKRNK